MRFAIGLVFLLTSCASVPDAPLSVLVYNIHAGKDAKGVDNLERVAALVESSQADVVLLQEVDRGTTRSGGVDQLAALMRLTGMHGVFGKSLDYQGGLYGIAILSRWPLTNEEVVPLRIDPPQPRAGGSLEPRIALVAETRGITVANTHFDASRDDTWRRQEVQELLRSASRRKVDFAGGDFNAEPASAIYSAMTGASFRDAWTLCGSGPGRTFPAHAPVKRIDYLFLKADFTCTSAEVLATETSDHRPLLIRVHRQGSASRNQLVRPQAGCRVMNQGHDHDFIRFG